MYCPKCGKLNDDGASFCKYCGASLSGDNTISFDRLNKGNSPVQRLVSEARTAHVFGILAIVFSALGGFIGPIFALINIFKINSLNQINFFPDDIMEIDTYESAKNKLYRARKMSIIALFVFLASSVLQALLLLLLSELGIDVYSFLI